MTRKLIEFPPFDIEKLYKELKEKGIPVRKWFEEEYKKLFPDIIKTRIIYANSSITCCKHGVDIYTPQEREVKHHETGIFIDSLEEWVTKVASEFREFIRDLGADECEGLGTDSVLCKFYFEVTDSEEYDGEYKEEET